MRLKFMQASLRRNKRLLNWRERKLLVVLIQNESTSLQRVFIHYPISSFHLFVFSLNNSLSDLSISLSLSKWNSNSIESYSDEYGARNSIIISVYLDTPIRYMNNK